MTHLPGPATTHPDHDTILVAALAAGDLADLARADAEALVAGCPDCAALHDDLVAIASATRALPAPARTRDFRLTPEQAAALRPSGVRRLLAAFGSPRLAVTRPLAVTFTTLGIAGLLLTAIPAGGPLGVFSSAAQRTAGNVGAPDVEIQGGGEASPLGPLVPAATDGPKAPVPTDAVAADRDHSATDSATVPGPVPWLLVLSLSLLSAGIALFAARRLGRLD